MNNEKTIYQHIEKAIVEHRLVPGTRLQEVKLSEIYSVKRGLIRKVLTKLISAKLVEHKANIGAQVACPTIEEAHDLFATRQILERGVVRHLCEHITPKQITFLHQILDEEERSYQQGDIEKGKSLSADFHLKLAKLTDNQVLIQYVYEILKRTPLVLLTYGHDNERDCINIEHRDIVDAIEKNDPERALFLISQHTNHIESTFKHPIINTPKDLTEALNQ